MDLDEMIAGLEEKDTPKAFAQLKELEALSEESDVLYPYTDKFIEMTGDDKYVIRVRGFRLLCRQARWDGENRIDANIKEVLGILRDDKPTAVRQALAALQSLVPYKKELHSVIREHILAIDYIGYKETMHSLIAKDVQALLKTMGSL